LLAPLPEEVKETNVTLTGLKRQSNRESYRYAQGNGPRLPYYLPRTDLTPRHPHMPDLAKRVFPPRYSAADG